MNHPQCPPPALQLPAAAPALLEARKLALFYLAPYATAESELPSARLLPDAVQQAHGCGEASERSTTPIGEEPR